MTPNRFRNIWIHDTAQIRDRTLGYATLAENGRTNDEASL